MAWRLRRAIRQSERRLRKADTPAAVLDVFERFTDDVARLRERVRARENRRKMSYLP